MNRYDIDNEPQAWTDTDAERVRQRETRRERVQAALRATMEREDCEETDIEVQNCGLSA